MVKLLYLGGLRRGELFAVRWGDFTGSTISIHRQINRFGNETTVKTKASEAPVSLPEDVCDDLNEWRKWCSDTKPEAFMFASRNGSPINYKNWLERVLKPAATAAGVERITYHMFRRGLATEAHQLHIVDKNVQSQLRHANVKTTVDLYTRGVPAEQAKAMQQLSDASAR
jgi:integrase